MRRNDSDRRVRAGYAALPPTPDRQGRDGDNTGDDACENKNAEHDWQRRRMRSRDGGSGGNDSARTHTRCGDN
jgi:hypothetical protein